MSEPSTKELQDSIDELSAYRDRLIKEVNSIGQKLQMPEKKITSILKENTELVRIEKLLSKLIAQKEMKNMPS